MQLWVWAIFLIVGICLDKSFNIILIIHLILLFFLLFDDVLISF